MKIRLHEAQQQAIKALAQQFFDSDRVWIFGSRADPDKKGGDIDVYIKTKRREGVLGAKLAFLREFEKRFGEQHVDLLVDNGTKRKEIYEIAQKEGVAL
jgi:predicted nucleotidyltransferase